MTDTMGRPRNSQGLVPLIISDSQMLVCKETSEHPPSIPETNMTALGGLEDYSTFHKKG